jgi:hypothetical protein
VYFFVTRNGVFRFEEEDKTDSRPDSGEKQGVSTLKREVHEL